MDGGSPPHTDHGHCRPRCRTGRLLWGAWDDVRGEDRGIAARRRGSSLTSWAGVGAPRGRRAEPAPRGGLLGALSFRGVPVQCAWGVCRGGRYAVPSGRTLGVHLGVPYPSPFSGPCAPYPLGGLLRRCLLADSFRPPAQALCLVPGSGVEGALRVGAAGADCVGCVGSLGWGRGVGGVRRGALWGCVLGRAVSYGMRLGRAVWVHPEMPV